MVIIIILLCFADSQVKAQQKPVPRIDTIENVRVLIDEQGVSYPILKTRNNRSYILKMDKKIFLYRKPEQE